MGQPFRFQSFAIKQEQAAMKVSTDGILLGAWATIGDAQSALDIGTGTGLIALMLAQRSADLQIKAVEIDQPTAIEANYNATTSPYADRVEVIPEAIQAFAHATQSSFDLIISNPPFFTGGVLSDHAERASVRHTIKLSHQDLLRSVQRLLTPGGRFCLVLPWMEGLRFQELAVSYQLYTQRRCKVQPRPNIPPNRWLLELGKTPVDECVAEELTIYAEATGTSRSSQFHSLTSEFYLPGALE